MQRRSVRFGNRPLNTISQAEPRLSHSQEVLLVLITWGFVRKINTRPRVGAILAFLRHDTGVPDFPVHRDKPGTVRAFRPNSNLGLQSRIERLLVIVFMQWVHLHQQRKQFVWQISRNFIAAA
jgi:hypothetical protein